MPEMNTERLIHLRPQENVEMRAINRELLKLAGVGDRTMEQTVRERDLEARRLWLTTKDAVLGFFGLTGKKTREAGGIVSDRISQVANEVNHQMKDWWKEQQAAKTRQEQSQEAHWVERMQQYEELKLKEAEGRDLEMGETVQAREIETELSVREAQQFLGESLAKAQDQLSRLSESVDNQGAKAYRYVAVLTVAASLAAACSGPDQRATTTPTGEGDTGPTPTLVVPPTEVPTQLPPTETPTEIPTPIPPTETPEPTAIPEKVYFAGITESELQSYAEKCKFCGIFESHFSGEQGHSYGMKVIFTDKYVSREIVDPVTGKIVANIDAMVAVTRDGESNPKLVLVPVQSEKVDNPGQNTLRRLADWAVAGYPANFPPSLWHRDLYDMSEISKIMAGTHAKVIFSLDASLFEYDSEEITNTLFKDAVYKDKVISLTEPNGGSMNNNDPIMIWPHGFNPLKNDGSAMF